MRVMLLLGLTGCGGVTYENQGPVCPLDVPEWEDGGSIALLVRLDDLGCSARDALASCTTELVDGTITVESAGSFRSATVQLACESAIYHLEAHCDTPPLAAGTYTVVHGDDTFELVLPGVADEWPAEFEEPVCFGD